MAISDYLLNYPQAPKLKTNYAANALQNLQQSGNPFAGIAGALLSPFAAKTDRDNAQALQQYEQEAGLAQTLMNWGRQDDLAQRQRDWDLQDAQTERENKLADALAQYRREDDVAQRNRDWALADRAAEFDNNMGLIKAKQEGDLAKALIGFSSQPKELTPFEKAFQAEEGKKKAQYKQEYENQQALFDNAQQITNELRYLADEATYSPFGRFLDGIAHIFGSGTPGSVAKEKYQQTINNELIPKLKQYLGGQFTEKEGEMLRQTLGDVNATPAEKKAAIDAFMFARERALNQARDKAMGQLGTENDNPLNL